MEGFSKIRKDKIMSKMYKRYLELKHVNNEEIYLFKSGIFYIFLDNDAQKMAPILNLKLTNLNENILKCGFPVNNLSKYLKIINNAGYSIKIVESVNSTPISENDFLLNSSVKKILIDLASIETDTLSIKEAYSLLENLSSNAKQIQKEMNITNGNN